MGRVEESMPLVPYVAAEMLGRLQRGDRDDFRSDAALGLLEADRKFDEAIATAPFHVYARRIMQQRVIDGWRVRYGRREGSAKLEGVFLRSLDETVDIDDNEKLTLGDRILDSGPDEYARICDRDLIRDLFSCLDPRSARWLWEVEAADVKQVRIAEREGLTESRVSQVLREAKRQVRASVSA